jgi:hypothetical protein
MRKAGVSSATVGMLCLAAMAACSRRDGARPAETRAARPVVRTEVVEVVPRSAESGRVAPGVQEVLNEDVRTDGFPKSMTPSNCGATISWWAPSPCGVTLDGDAIFSGKRVIPRVRRSGAPNGACQQVTRFETTLSQLPADTYRFDAGSQYLDFDVICVTAER